jgi:hypothetical protein
MKTVLFILTLALSQPLYALNVESKSYACQNKTWGWLEFSFNESLGLLRFDNLDAYFNAMIPVEKWIAVNLSEEDTKLDFEHDWYYTTVFNMSVDQGSFKNLLDSFVINVNFDDFDGSYADNEKFTCIRK